MRAVLCSPERESGWREEASGGGGSLFSLPACLCLPIPVFAGGVVSCTFAQCLTIDGSLIFVRAAGFCHFLAVGLLRDEPLRRKGICLAVNSLNLVGLNVSHGETRI